MSTSRCIDVLVVAHDGRRLACVRIHPRVLCAAVVLTLSVLVGVSATLWERRPHVQIAAAALPPSPAPEHALGEQAAHQQQCDVLALVQQRLPELETEIAGWREAQASLRQVLRVRQAAAEPPEARDD